MEYKRVRKHGNLIRETTDFVADLPISDNRIIPDGVFIIENIESRGGPENLDSGISGFSA
jgi:hypothetical protein